MNVGIGTEAAQFLGIFVSNFGILSLQCVLCTNPMERKCRKDDAFSIV
jgi:hypothetical protein